MEKFFNAIAIPTVYAVSIIELLLLIYLISKFIKTKSLFLLLTAILTFGLFYDAFIISLGTITSANNMIFLSRIRFVLHGCLVPLLFIISFDPIELSKKWKITIYAITGVFIVLGFVSSILSKYEVIELADISRLVIDKEKTPVLLQHIPTLLNVISIIPLIVVGVIVQIKKKNIYLLLSGVSMFFFSAIGPALRASNYIFLISMFGEVLLVMFAIQYFVKEERKAKE